MPDNKSDKIKYSGESNQATVIEDLTDISTQVQGSAITTSLVTVIMVV